MNRDTVKSLEVTAIWIDEAADLIIGETFIYRRPTKAEKRAAHHRRTCARCKTERRRRIYALMFPGPYPTHRNWMSR